MQRCWHIFPCGLGLGNQGPQKFRYFCWLPLLQAKTCVCDPAQPWLYCESLSYLDLNPKVDARYKQVSKQRLTVEDSLRIPQRRRLSGSLKPCDVDIGTMLRAVGCFSGSCSAPIAPPLISLQVAAEVCVPTLRMVSGIPVSAAPFDTHVVQPGCCAAQQQLLHVQGIWRLFGCFLLWK